MSVKVLYKTSAKATGGRNTIRRTGVAAGGLTMTYDYGSGSSIADNSSRVYQIKQSSTALVTYSYNGVSQVIRTYLEEPDAFARVVHYFLARESGPRTAGSGTTSSDIPGRSSP